jgi:uncharacterized protein (DUF1800 family)
MPQIRTTDPPRRPGSAPGAGLPLQRSAGLEHVLRRAGFGARPDELEAYAEYGPRGTIRLLLDYESVPDTVDSYIGQPGYVGVTARGAFAPNTNITDARQRWLFRMIHTERPLQEKMALFWHNHFATAYSKIQGVYNASEATRMMAAKPSEDPGRVRGQYELFREHALGNFRELLVEVAKDPAMLVWLDGRLNTRTRPQENFARELMELFTMGVNTFTEEDVYAGARVFTGWNLRRVGANSDPAGYYEFFYNAAQHDTGAKTFSFPIYPDGNRTIPARASDAGLQDGIDLVNAVAAHPETGPRLARKLWAFFVSEIEPAPASFVSRVAAAYYRAYEMRDVVGEVLQSPEFGDRDSVFARYAWPVEFVVRAVKEVGWRGFSVNDALTPLVNMGQQLFEPPDVNGWELGRAWFSTGGTLARMNFAATLTTNQRFEIRNAAREAAASPEALLSWTMNRLSVMRFEQGPLEDLLAYLRSSAWTGSDTQLLTKAPGLFHLVLGASEYQLV